MKHIQLIKNTKLPAVKWSANSSHVSNVDMIKYNSGLLTGKVNNLIVLDIDVKDNGLKEFESYCLNFGKPKTKIQSTPNGGFHYLFSMLHHKPEVQYIIQNVLTTKSKYRGVGLDIRSNGGYIVTSPSTINDKQYKYINNEAISEMPEQLVYWLIELCCKTDHKVKKTSNVLSAESKSMSMNSGIVYEISDDELVSALAKLSPEYVANIDKWLLITDVLKNMNKFQIWDNWSKSHSKYDLNKNVDIWNGLNGILNVNYLMNVIKAPLIKTHKPIPTNIFKADKIVNHKYVSECISYDEFIENESIVIKSCTGTGKTTCIAKYTNLYLKANPHLQILSITNLISLGRQHDDSFKKEGVNMVSYDNPKIDITNDNVYCCVNSLVKLYGKLNTDCFKNYIIYIDEITTFIEYLTHCELLDSQIKSIYTLLIKIIKNCHKLIVSDASINTNVFNFIEHKGASLYIENTYKKYQNTPAINYKDENDFIDVIREHIRSDKYFLFGSDWNARITDIYNLLSKELSDKASNMILITSDTKFIVKDASEQFKNKFVFYSPSITTAIDFSISEAQDVFIYMSGKSILPTGTFQQTTRTRNINTLHYYSVAKQNKINYASYEDLVKDYLTMTKTSSKINDICVAINEDDEETVIENTFFKLLTYNEYLSECYRSNPTTHFKNILIENGFVITSTGTTKTVDIDVLEKFAEIREDITNELFEAFITGDRTASQFEIIITRLQMLKLNADDDIRKYKDIIMDKYKLEDHLNVIRLLKTDKHIQDKLNCLSPNSYNVKLISNIYSKIKLVRAVMGTNNLLSVFSDANINFNVDIHTHALSNKIFRMTKPAPIDRRSYLKYLSTMLNQLGDIVISKHTKSGSSYTLDEDKLKMHIELDNFNNPRRTNYDESIKKHFEVGSIIEEYDYSNLDKGLIFEDI